MSDDGGYAAVVFDMDGTLVEYTSHDLRRAVASETFAAVGIDPTEAELRAVAEESTANARDVCETHGVDPAAFYERFDPALADRQRTVVDDGGKPPYDDARTALSEIGDGVATAVLSDNYQSVVDRVVARHFPSQFAVARGVAPGLEGRQYRKPDPTNLQQTLAEMDVAAERALFVGDSPRDVAVAARADVDSAFVRRDGARADGHEPTHRLDDLGQLAQVVSDA